MSFLMFMNQTSNLMDGMGALVGASLSGNSTKYLWLNHTAETNTWVYTHMFFDTKGIQMKKSNFHGCIPESKTSKPKLPG